MLNDVMYPWCIIHNMSSANMVGQCGAIHEKTLRQELDLMLVNLAYNVPRLEDESNAI